MNVKELSERLILEGIPSNSYSIEEGIPDDKICLRKINNRWEVYFSERGEKSNTRIFHTEEEACMNMYERLKDMMKYL